MGIDLLLDYYRIPPGDCIGTAYEDCLRDVDPDTSLLDLKMERYASVSPGSERAMSRSIVRSAYYLARPLMPVSVRRRFQRRSLKGWESIPFPSWPVDFTADRLAESMLTRILEQSGSGSLPFIWFWPGGFKSCTMLTHDVETAAGRDSVTSLMDIDDSFGLKSSFQIIPERRYAVSEDLLGAIRSRGFEVNVHDLNHDGRLYSNRKTFTARAAKINAYCRQYGARGFRSGVLYRNLEWYSDYDFSYDMSVPNVGHLDPQRGGCCTVMPYFIGSILELPLTTIQDYPLFHILGEYSTDLWKKQLELIDASCGLASFNVHPDYLLEKNALECYRSLLSYLADRRGRGDTWHALPGEVNDWWRFRHGLSLVSRDGAWRIEGEGSERAVVAYAKLVDGKLVYENARHNAIETRELGKQ